MITVSAFLITCFTFGNNNAHQNFNSLINQLADELEWIDEYGSEMRSSDQVRASINELIDQLADPSIALRHQSEWKNDKCFQIFHVSSSISAGYRMFFQCERNNIERSIVTKIKVSQVRL